MIKNLSERRLLFFCIDKDVSWISIFSVLSFWLFQFWGYWDEEPCFHTWPVSFLHPLHFLAVQNCTGTTDSRTLCGRSWHFCLNRKECGAKRKHTACWRNLHCKVLYPETSHAPFCFGQRRYEYTCCYDYGYLPIAKELPVVQVDWVWVLITGYR